jgi:hypothetical protein
MKKFISLLLCAVLLFSLAACAGGMGALDITERVRENFAFKYGAVYSDAYSEWNEFYLSPEMKTKIFGANSEKYTYIKAVSGYFSRDMVSGAEFVAIELCDRSHRAEVMVLLYRHAAKKLDSDARVFCEGKFVFLVCDRKAEEIIEYVREKCKKALYFSS